MWTPIADRRLCGVAVGGGSVGVCFRSRRWVRIAMDGRRTAVGRGLSGNRCSICRASCRAHCVGRRVDARR
eukprot:3802196-Pleurochrysis_carterae.AAC.1